MPKLCKAGQQLREQIDDDYPDRDRRSDGWIADARHLAKGNSDHIPDARGIVRGLDVDADLNAHKEEAYALVEKIRKCATMSSFVANFQGQFSQDLLFVSIANFSNIIGLEWAQVSQCCILRIKYNIKLYYIIFIK